MTPSGSRRASDCPLTELRQLLGQVEADRHRPDRPVGQPHLGADALVVGLTQERRQRREGAVHQQLDVADLAGRQVPRRPVRSGGLQLGGPLRIDDQVDEGAAMGGDEVIRHSVPPGGWLEGGPAGNCQPDGAPRPFALAGILKTRLQAQPQVPWGTNGTLRDNRFRTRKKGPPERPLWRVRHQSSSQDTEALSAAGAVRRRRALMPRDATVWTVDSRMARSRLTDQFST